ncbi:MAG TPA: hypothetical protein VIF02_06680 [Methylocella sp.]
MTTRTAMRTACGAICLAGSPSTGEPAKASPARLSRGLLQMRLAKFVRASDLRIPLLAFLGWQIALYMFHLAMFSKEISRWTPKLRG